MIHRANECKSEVREAMRGGDKSVKITHFFDENNELMSPTRLCAQLELEPGASIGFHAHENEEEFRTALDKLLSDRELCARFSEKSREIAIKFDRTYFGASVVDVYNKVIEEKSSKQK